MNKKIEYWSFEHHSSKHGYQNIHTARTFARWVKKQIIKKYPTAKDEPVAMLVIDTSSVFLSAFVKILMPHWIIISGSKDEFKHGYEDTPVATVFIDDYFHNGDTVSNVIKAAKKRGLLNKSIDCYFIKESYLASNFQTSIQEKYYPINLAFNSMLNNDE